MRSARHEPRETGLSVRTGRAPARRRASISVRRRVEAGHQLRAALEPRLRMAIVLRVIAPAQAVLPSAPSARAAADSAPPPTTALSGVDPQAALGGSAGRRRLVTCLARARQPHAHRESRRRRWTAGRAASAARVHGHESFWTRRQRPDTDNSRTNGVDRRTFESRV